MPWLAASKMPALSRSAPVFLAAAALAANEHRGRRRRDAPDLPHQCAHGRAAHDDARLVGRALPGCARRREPGAPDGGAQRALGEQADPLGARVPPQEGFPGAGIGKLLGRQQPHPEGLRAHRAGGCRGRFGHAQLPVRLAQGHEQRLVRRGVFEEAKDGSLRHSLAPDGGLPRRGWPDGARPRGTPGPDMDSRSPPALRTSVAATSARPLRALKPAGEVARTGLGVERTQGRGPVAA